MRAVDDLKAHYRLPLLLQIAGLFRSTFYDHRRRLSGEDTRAGIKEAIRDVFHAAKSAYGHRRILAVLLRQGWQVSKKTVLKLMRQLGLHCPVRRRKRYNSLRGEVGQAAENILNRQFTAESPHTKWATDVTEFTVGGTKVYVSPVLDLHDNRIISATAGPSPSVKMVTEGLRTAIATLNPTEKPIVHSDQGFQYRHTLWRDTLRRAGLTQSMSRKGTCLDNAVIEAFFSHLKEEWFRIHKTRKPPGVPRGPDYLPGMVEHHQNSAAARLPQPRRIPHPTNRHRIEFHYQVQLFGTTSPLRQYFPRGIDLSSHSARELRAVADELNGRPRKTLNWDTPAEQLAALLDAS